MDTNSNQLDWRCHLDPSEEPRPERALGRDAGRPLAAPPAGCERPGPGSEPRQPGGGLSGRRRRLALGNTSSGLVSPPARVAVARRRPPGRRRPDQGSRGRPLRRPGRRRPPGCRDSGRPGETVPRPRISRLARAGAKVDLRGNRMGEGGPGGHPRGEYRRAIAVGSHVRISSAGSLREHDTALGRDDGKPSGDTWSADRWSDDRPPIWPRPPGLVGPAGPGDAERTPAGDTLAARSPGAWPLWSARPPPAAAPPPPRPHGDGRHAADSAADGSGGPGGRALYRLLAEVRPAGRG